LKTGCPVILDVEPLHILGCATASSYLSTERRLPHPAKERVQPRVICLMHIVSKETKSIQDSEADTGHRAETLPALIYRR
jgi:hypothetical protein